MTRAMVDHRVVNHCRPSRAVQPPVTVKRDPHACVVSGCEELFSTKAGRALHLADHMGAQ